MKHKVKFQDYFMQRFYEDLIDQGWSDDKAVSDTVEYFRKYDDGEL